MANPSFLRCLFFSSPPTPVKQLTNAIYSKWSIRVHSWLGPPFTVVTESWSKECSKLLPGPSSKFYLFLTVQLCDWLSQLPKLKSLGRPRQNFASLSSSASFRLTCNIYYFEQKNWQKRNQRHCCRDLKSTLKHIAKKIPSQTEVAPRRTQKL